MTKDDTKKIRVLENGSIGIKKQSMDAQWQTGLKKSGLMKTL